MKDGNKVKQVKECTNLEKYKRENAQWVGRLKHIQKKYTETQAQNNNINNYNT